MLMYGLVSLLVVSVAGVNEMYQEAFASKVRELIKYE